MATVLFVFSLAMVVLSLLFISRGMRQSRSEKIVRNLRAGQVDTSGTGLGRSSDSSWQRTLTRAGVTLPPWLVVCGGVLMVLGLLLLYANWGWWAAALGLVVVVALVPLLLRLRYARRVERMVHQLPGTLDHMIRSLKSGRTLGDAMMLAMDRAQNPLHSALAPVRRSIELGITPGEALGEFAGLYDREEFQIFAMGIRINQRYGGNASDMLDKLIVLIRDREKARRQLRALTGETRISAVVLGVLPVALAGYIFTTNPDFFMGLWDDATGRLLLFIAVCLQVTGCLLLWRMLKSL